MKSPRVALILSALFPGLGQFYNRHWFKGLGFFIGSGMISGIVSESISVDDIASGTVSGAGQALVFLLALLGLLIWSMVDAYRSAKNAPPAP
jgi:TM2 domain-containing membrane protein YozV